MKQKTVIVTGAAGGLGSALVLEAVRAGWNTVMVDKNRRALEQAYDRAEQEGGGNAVLFPADLEGAGPDDYDTMLASINSEFGGLTALVHCAARFDSLTPIEHISPADWLGHMQVNLNAAWLLSVKCIPLLRESAPGRLVFLLEDMKKMEGPLWGAYGISKLALKSLVEKLARECKPAEIEVRGVDPGPMSTPLRARAYHSEHPRTQQAPSIVAEKIMSYLDGRQHWSDVFVGLKQAD